MAKEKGYIGSVGSELRQKLVQDVALRMHAVERFRGYLAKGGVYYVLSVVFLVAGISLGRSAILEIVQHYNSLKTDIRDILRGQFEPRRDESAFGVVAATLGAMNRDDATTHEALCPPGEGDCSRVEPFLSNFVTLAKSWSDFDVLPLDPIVANVAVDKIMDTSPSGLPIEKWGPVRTDWIRTVTTGIECPIIGAPAPMWWACSDLASLSTLCETEPNANDTNKSHDLDWGPRFCDSSQSSPWKQIHLSLSPLSIPGQREKGRPASPILMSDLSDLPPVRIAQAVRLSRVLGPALESAGFSVDHPEATPNAFAFVQAYFISPDDVLRIWRRPTTPPTEHSVGDFPRTRHWSAQKYFSNLMDGAEDETSAAYIDYGGNGIIRTRCHAVKDRAQKLLGAICGDITIPISTIAMHLIGSQLLDARWISAMPDNKGHFDPSNVEIKTMEQVVDAKAKALDEPRFAESIANELNTSFVRNSSDEDASSALKVLSREVLKFRSAWGIPAGELAEAMKSAKNQNALVDMINGNDGKGEQELFFFIPGGRRAGRLEGFVVCPKVSLPKQATLLLVLSGLCLLVTLGLVTAGTIRARARNERAVVSELLSTLQVGIVVVDEQDRVEAGNNRAEETLGEPLSKFGPSLDLARGAGHDTPLDPGAVLPRFSDLIEDEIWFLLDEERLDRQSYAAVVKDSRDSGESSTYYATLRSGKKAGALIRVSATPIEPSRPRRTGDWPRTFGIIEELTSYRQGAMKRRIAMNRRRLQAEKVREHVLLDAADVISIGDTMIERTKANEERRQRTKELERQIQELQTSLDEGWAETMADNALIERLVKINGKIGVGEAST